MKVKNALIYELGLNTIKSLEVTNGVLASSKKEIYGCIFGRDSLITALRLLSAYDVNKDPYYLGLVKKILQGLTELQGKTVNIESGEEPGKCIHEFRTENFEHLSQGSNWYVYEDQTIRNFDSLDATPLFLITTYRYWQKSDDDIFIDVILRHIDLALSWIIEYGDKNADGLIDYQLHPERKFGGLVVQSWMDSAESIFHQENGHIVYPIAPVESQAYVYLAFKLWSQYFSQKGLKSRAELLLKKADALKEIFNKRFIISQSPLTIAYAIDGNDKPLLSPRSSLGHILWATVNPIDDGYLDCILDQRHLPTLVNRLLQSDIFEPKAGIRTLSKEAKEFHHMSYHNGSIWPHDTSIIAEGMEKLGYHHEAKKIRRALFYAYSHFNTPIELFSFWENSYQQYQSAHGQISCQEQAWSAASMIVDSLLMKK